MHNFWRHFEGGRQVTGDQGSGRYAHVEDKRYDGRHVVFLTHARVWEGGRAAALEGVVGEVSSRRT